MANEITDQKSIENTLIEFHRYFTNLWSDSKPLAKLFRTEKRGYLYDTGTNRIYACRDLEFNLLHNLMTRDVGNALDKMRSLYQQDEFLQALNGIQNVIETKNILKTKAPTQFGLSSHYKNLEEMIQNSLGMVQLEITERCNLRCAYCIYNSHFTQKRNHGIHDMSLDTACRAIDHLARSSRHKENIAVTFYGGEPLLRFPFIQSCVQYAHKVLTRKFLHFSLTTNATLLTPKMAKYFAQEKFGVHVSLDGPEDINDDYRRNARGDGSFQRTISGLKMLYDAYDDQKHNITLSMVYTPPFSDERVSRVAQLWDEFSWLPWDMGLSISYAHGFHPYSKESQYHTKLDFSLFQWARKKFIEGYKAGIKAHPIALSFIEKGLAQLFQRQITTAPRNKYHLNGCCLPGVRKLYVSVEGTLSLCERMGMAPEIGNILTGIDTKYVYDIYVKEFDRESLPFCSECWALQLCNICYAHAYSNGKLDMRMKNKNCMACQQMTLEFLKLYCSLLEINESGLDYLLDFHIH